MPLKIIVTSIYREKMTREKKRRERREKKRKEKKGKVRKRKRKRKRKGKYLFHCQRSQELPLPIIQNCAKK